MDAANLAIYRAAYRQRLAQEAAQLDERRETAWVVARRAAEILRVRYGARRVLVFGSLARGSDFTEHSDIDLLAWGIPWGQDFTAVAEIAAIDDVIEVNLVIGELARPVILERAETEGVEL